MILHCFACSLYAVLLNDQFTVRTCVFLELSQHSFCLRFVCLLFRKLGCALEKLSVGLITLLLWFGRGCHSSIQLDHKWKPLPCHNVLLFGKVQRWLGHHVALLCCARQQTIVAWLFTVVREWLLVVMNNVIAVTF